MTAPGARLAALLLLVFGVLPLAGMVPGGIADDGWARRWGEWGWGLLICGGAAAVAAILARGRRRAPAEGPLAVAWPSPPRWAPALAVAAGALYAIVARHVFDGQPLLIDEIVQVRQALLYAAGALSEPVAPHPEFTSVLHWVDTGARGYAQFPPGGPAMLALGVLAGGTWLVGPAAGAVATWAMARIAPRLAPDAPRVAWAIVVLFALAPFGVFMFASHMNHATALAWLLLAVASLAEATHGDGRAAAWALLCGLSLGVAATIRPLDAAAFALPAAAWLLRRALRDPAHRSALLWSGVGVALPFAVMAWVNLRTTGAPLRFGYEVLWGRAHGLGFHAAPWGEAHTPRRALELAGIYATRLQSYLFELPVPSLLFPVAGLALWPHRLRPLDRYLLASGALLALAYALYWHDGFFLGPRFVFPLLPLLCVWSVRGVQVAADRLRAPSGRAALAAFLGAALLLGVTTVLPYRVRQYRGGLWSMRVDYDTLADRAGVRDAVVLVRESWGAQVIARLWAAGVSRPAAEALYRGIDLCQLDQALAAAEGAGLRGPALEGRLRPLLADSARVIPSPVSPDRTERVRPDLRYPASCLRRLAEDRHGYAHLAPVQRWQRTGNVWARDLQARDSLLLALHPARPVWLLARADTTVTAPFRFVPLSRDSLLAAWRTGR